MGAVFRLLGVLKRLGLLVSIAAFSCGPALAAPEVTTLFSFANDAKGEHPVAAPILGPDGALYGTTYQGGPNGIGTVYRVAPAAPGQPWKRKVLYTFRTGNNGSGPIAGLLMGPDGALYGTTESGGGGECSGGCGVVYQLTPQAGGDYSFKSIHRFSSVADGVRSASQLVMDADGVIYGTTIAGGTYDGGTLFSLTRDGDSWTKKTLYRFRGGADGQYPQSGVVFGPDGALYGTTLLGGNAITPRGAVYRAAKRPNGNWTTSIIYAFSGGAAGERPRGAVAFDADGALYGTTSEGGSAPCFAGCGTIFRLTGAGTAWTGEIIYRFDRTTGATPQAELAVDRSGALWGMTPSGGSASGGVILRLRPPAPGKTAWRPTVIHNFTGAGADGSTPYGGLIRDADTGDFFGTTRDGGNGGGSSGTVFRLAP